MSWTNLEIIIFLGLFLLGLYILHDHLVCHIPRTHHKVPPPPYVPSPISLPDMGKLHQDLPGGLPFDILHQFTGRKTWRHRHKQMHMIPRNMPFQNLYFVAQTNLSNQLPDSNRYLFRQDRSPIFRDPHKMQFDIVPAMRSNSIKLHAANYTKVIA
jgi:hypothetical protein